ncbi:MAG: hypothetical protein K2P99_01465, partial [Burkholderiales bacterium]|nr:hypothetical protein [Burkholderiales bacterium]
MKLAKLDQIERQKEKEKKRQSSEKQFFVAEEAEVSENEDITSEYSVSEYDSDISESNHISCRQKNNKIIIELTAEKLIEATSACAT